MGYAGTGRDQSGPRYHSGVSGRGAKSQRADGYPDRPDGKAHRPARRSPRYSLRRPALRTQRYAFAGFAGILPAGGGRWFYSPGGRFEFLSPLKRDSSRAAPSAPAYHYRTPARGNIGR